MAVRIPGPPRPFRDRRAGLDHFPIRLWSSRVHRRLRDARASTGLDYGARATRSVRRSPATSRRRATRAAPPTRSSSSPGRSVGLDLARPRAARRRRPGLARGAGLRRRPRRAHRRRGAHACPCRWTTKALDVDGLEARARRRARLIYVTPSHQFPLGVAMSLRRRLALLEWASHARAWILEDDYDSEFRYTARGRSRACTASTATAA